MQYLPDIRIECAWRPQQKMLITMKLKYKHVWGGQPGNAHRRGQWSQDAHAPNMILVYSNCYIYQITGDDAQLQPGLSCVYP